MEPRSRRHIVGEVLRVVSVLVLTFVVAGCGARQVYWREGAGPEERQRDYLACEHQAIKHVQAWEGPGRADLNRPQRHVRASRPGGSQTSNTAAFGERGDEIHRCMTVKGYRLVPEFELDH